MMQTLISVIPEERIHQKTGLIEGSSFLEFNNSNLLDTFNKPSVLINNDGIICNANRLWYKNFKTTPDFTIGSSLNIFGDIRNFVKKPINHSYSIGYVDINSKLEALKTRVQTLEKHSINLYSSSIPRCFLLSENCIGIHESPFVIKLIINFSSSVFETNDEQKIIPSEWLKEQSIFENWIEGRCNYYSQLFDVHINMIKSEVRHLVLLFGADNTEKIDPSLQVQVAFNLSLDALRYNLESEWPKSHLKISIALISQYNCQFKIEKDPNNSQTFMTINGNMTQKTIAIQSKMQKSSILLCNVTFEIIEKLNHITTYEQIMPLRATVDHVEYQYYALSYGYNPNNSNTNSGLVTGNFSSHYASKFHSKFPKIHLKIPKI